jgi:energy-coupling factor transporter ATP-binding protein EcfA2
MLQKITIENYRCFSEHEVEFKDLSIVVGKNNAGKSTLIEVLRLVSLALGRFRTGQYRDHPKWIDLPKIARGIILSLDNLEFNSENIFHHYGDPPSKIVAYFTNQNRVTIYIGNKSEIFCTLINGRDEYIISRGSALSLDILPMSILPQISPITKKETLLGKEYVRRSISTDLASLHFRNQIALLYEHFPKFSEMAEQSWNGLRIVELSGRMDMQGDPVSLLVQDGGFVSEVGWMGHGLQMWLQIIWFLSRINENEIVILDEPDVYMHPDLQRKLIRLLRNKFKQVIVATHSIEIISEVEPENILIIDKEKGKSIFANKVPVVQRILNSIGSIHNLQLTKLWASKKLLIVEGEDIAILKRLQNILFPESIEPFDSIPNFDIGGWGGWSTARGSGKLLKETVDDTIKIYCLFDSDYHSKEVKDKRIEEAERIGISIHIWQRKEIESYLIVASAILRILKSASKKAASLTVSNIERLIEEKALELEDDTLNNFADEIQKQARINSVSSARKKAKEIIDNLKFKVNAKELISLLSSWTQEHYKVSLSPIKLATNLEKMEIAKEVRTVIEVIERGRLF